MAVAAGAEVPNGSVPHPVPKRAASPAGASREMSRGRMRSVWLLVFGVLFLAFSLSVPVHGASNRLTGDEPQYLLMTDSLLTDGDLDLTDEFRDRVHAPYHPDTVHRQDEPRPDGRRISPHDPGLSVLLVPGYAIGGWIGARVQLALLAAAVLTGAGVLASRFVRRPWWAAPAAALACGLSVPLWVYSTQVYPEMAAAGVLVLVALLWTGEWARGREVAAALLTAVAIVVLAWLGTKYLPLCAAIGVTGLVRWRHRPASLVALVLAVLVGGAHVVAVHLDLYGGLTPYAANRIYAGEGTGYLLADNSGGLDRTYRLHGLLFDRRFGLVRYAPIWMLALPGLIVLWACRSTRKDWWPLAVLVLVQWGTATWLALTMMGWWFPGRQVVAVLPLLVPAVAVGIAALPRLAALIAAYGMVVAGSLVVLMDRGDLGAAKNPFLLTLPGWTTLGGLFPQFTSFSAATYVASTLWLGLLALLCVVVSRRMGEDEMRLLAGPALEGAST